MKKQEPDKKKQSAFSGKGVDSLFGDAADKKEPAPQAADPKAKKENEDVLLAKEALHAFENHPFGVRDDDDMQQLQASIEESGLRKRIEVRPRSEGGYEIISGHRRFEACKRLGMKEIPVTIYHNLDNDEAIKMMVDENLHRSKILPSERAKSIQMKKDAMSRQGKRDGKGRSDEEIAKSMGMSRATLQRYVRLLKLSPELLEMVDNDQLSEHPGYELSYLSPGEQALVHDYLWAEDRKPSKAQALALKEHSQELKKGGNGKGRDLSDDEIERIMDGERLPEIFPPPPPPKEQQAEKEEGAAPPAPTAGGQQEPPTAAGQPPTAAQEQASGAPPPPIPFPAFDTSQAGSGAKEQVAQPTGAATDTKPIPSVSSVTLEAGAEVALTDNIKKRAQSLLQLTHIVVPKSEVRQFLPPCASNDEYTAALVATLSDAHKKLSKDKTVNASEPPKVDTKSPATPAKPPEPPKMDTKAPATPAKPPEPPKVDTKTPAITPVKADTAKEGSGTEALDDFLKNKAKPDKGKQGQNKSTEPPTK